MPELKPHPAAAPRQPSPRPETGSPSAASSTSPVSPYDELDGISACSDPDAKGNVIFEQKDVEVPKDGL